MKVSVANNSVCVSLVSATDNWPIGSLEAFSKDCNENTIESKPNHIIINLSSDKDESDINIIFNNFVKEISSYVEPSTQNKKIKVNIIKIKKTKVINSVPNPDYVVYEEQNANIRDLASKDKDDFTIKEFLLKTPPTTTIETIEIKKTYSYNSQLN